MSWATVKAVVAYLDANTQSTPEARQRLVRQMRSDHVQQLPFDASLEPFRGPVQNLSQPAELFNILDDNVFYLDLLDGNVVTAYELRQRFFEVLTAPIGAEGRRPVVWLVNDSYAHSCRVLFHFDGGDHYAIHNLFVSQEELERASTLHESLLLAFIALADARTAEVRVARTPEVPLVRFLFSLLGFLRDDTGGGGGLMRPPMEEVVNATDLLATVRSQIDRLMHAQEALLLFPVATASPDGGGASAPLARPE